MTGGQTALRVAGVVGGAGTSTLVRILQLAFPRHLVRDLGRYQGGEVDVLVSNNTVDSVRAIGEALNPNPRRPVLVLMHTVPGVVRNSQPHLSIVEPNVSAVFAIDHRREWAEMASAPGRELPQGRRARDLLQLIKNLPAALSRMFAQPPRFPSAPTAAPRRDLPPHHASLGVGLPGALAVGVRAGPDGRPWSPPGGSPHHISRGSQAG